MDNEVQNQAPAKDKVINRLRSAGITPTQQRIDIAKILFACPQHLSAEQVLAIVNQDQAAVSKATVYNTLGLFAEKGLLRPVIVDPSKIFYDSNVAIHYHFYHTDTGELEDIPADAINLSYLPSAPEGTRQQGIEVIIRVKKI